MRTNTHISQAGPWSDDVAKEGMWLTNSSLPFCDPVPCWTIETPKTLHIKMKLMEGAALYFETFVIVSHRIMESSNF